MGMRKRSLTSCAVRKAWLWFWCIFSNPLLLSLCRRCRDRTVSCPYRRCGFNRSIVGEIHEFPLHSQWNVSWFSSLKEFPKGGVPSHESHESHEVWLKNNGRWAEFQ